jgi:A/G-specific adenine glycosylase
VTRLYAVEDVLPAAKPAIRKLAAALTPARRAGDFAQALMDLGATICTPRKPACVLCPWRDACAAYRRGDAESFPRKIRKRAGQVRRGAAFVLIRSDGCVLVRSRPSGGLLGGMTEVPTSEWSHDFQESAALVSAPRLPQVRLRWRRLPGEVAHVFTHFPLELVVYQATVPAGAVAPPDTRWVANDALAGEALPSVMRKVLAHALDALPAPRGAASSIANAGPADLMKPRRRTTSRRVT